MEPPEVGEASRLLLQSLPDVHKTPGWADTPQLSEDSERQLLGAASGEAGGVSAALGRLHWAMQALALLPAGGKKSVLRRALFAAYQMALVAWSLYLGQKVALMIPVYVEFFAFLHAFTVGALILVSKPLVVLANLGLFRLRLPAHARALQMLDEVGESLEGDIPSLARQHEWRWALAVAASTAALMGLRFCDFAETELPFPGNRSGAEQFDILATFPFILLIHLMTMLPLAFFAVHAAVLRDLSADLAARIRDNRGEGSSVLGRRSLQSFYKHFLRLTQLQSAFSDAHSPWIFASLGWGVLGLCLTVFFLTQTNFSMIVSLPSQFDGASEEAKAETLLMLRYHVLYAAAQMLVGAAHLLVICYVGTTANEETRGILRAVLDTVPAHEQTEEDRYQTTCFVHKTATQYFWGLTVWRAFPIERGVLLTIISLVASYAILLYKFKSHSSVPFVFSNSTRA